MNLKRGLVGFAIAAIVLGLGGGVADAGGPTKPGTEPTATVRLQGRIGGQGAPTRAVKVNLFELEGGQANDGPHENRGAFLGLTRTNEGGYFSYQVEPGCYVLVVIAPDGWLFRDFRSIDRLSRFYRTTACFDGSDPIVEGRSGQLVRAS